MNHLPSNAAVRLFRQQDARLLIEDGDASILVDDENGTVFFRYGNTGIGFNPRFGCWSAPLDFQISHEGSQNEN